MSTRRLRKKTSRDGVDDEALINRKDAIDLTTPTNQDTSQPNRRKSPQRSLFFKGSVDKDNVVDKYTGEPNYDDDDEIVRTSNNDGVASRTRSGNQGTNNDFSNNQIESNDNNPSEESDDENFIKPLHPQQLKAAFDASLRPTQRLHRRDPINESIAFHSNNQQSMDDGDFHFNNNHYVRSLEHIAPSYYQQIKQIEACPTTFLSNQHCNLQENTGSTTLVSTQPPEYELSQQQGSNSSPQLHLLIPTADYVISPQLHVFQIPKFNDFTSYCLYIAIGVFCCLVIGNLGSHFVHQYTLYNTIPRVQFNKYVLENYTIQRDGLGRINQLLSHGPPFWMSLQFILSSFYRQLFVQPSLNGLVDSAAHVMTKRKQHRYHYETRGQQRYNGQSYATNRYKKGHFSPTQDQFLDINTNNEQLKSSFYQNVINDHALCYANDLHQQPTSTTDNRFTFDPHDPKHQSVVGRISDWFTSRVINSELNYQHINYQFIYSRLFDFVFSSLVSCVFVASLGLWKDFTALGVICSLNSILQNNKRNQVTNTTAPSRFFASLPLPLQAPARAWSYVITFCTFWAITTCLFFHPMISFTFCCLVSMCIMRRRADPDRLFEAFLITYPDHQQQQVDEVSLDNNEVKPEQQQHQRRKTMLRERLRRNLHDDDEKDANVDDEEGEDDTIDQVVNNTNTTTTVKSSSVQMTHVGLGLITLRHMVVILGCAVLCTLAFHQVYDTIVDLSHSPQLSTKSPIDKRFEQLQLLSKEYITSKLSSFGQSITSWFKSSQPTTITALTQQTKQHAKEFLTSTKETSQLTADLLWSFISNLTTLTTTTLKTLFTPQFWRSTTIISPQDYPALLLHLCYIAMCTFFAIKMFFHMRNNNYIGRSFLSPFAAQYQQRQTVPLSRRYDRLHDEIDNFAFDDGVWTTIFQSWAIIGSATTFYFTGGVLLPMCYYLVHEVVMLVSDWRFFLNRHREYYQQRQDGVEMK